MTIELPEESSTPRGVDELPVERFRDESGEFPFIIRQYRPFTGLIDLNHADKALLMMLPGIGASTAESIIIRRTLTGGFGSLDELTTIPGIGPTTLDVIKPLVCLR